MFGGVGSLLVAFIKVEPDKESREGGAMAIISILYENHIVSDVSSFVVSIAHYTERKFYYSSIDLLLQKLNIIIIQPI